MELGSLKKRKIWEKFSDQQIAMGVFTRTWTVVLSIKVVESIKWLFRARSAEAEFFMAADKF